MARRGRTRFATALKTTETHGSKMKRKRRPLGTRRIGGFWSERRIMSLQMTESLRDSFNNHELFRPLHSMLELRIYIKDSGPETCRSLWTRQNAPQQRRRSAGITVFTAQRGKTGDIRRSQTDFSNVSRLLQMSDDFGKSKPDICKCRAPFRKVSRHCEMLSAFLKRRPTIDKVGCKFRLWSDFRQSRLTF